jgi:hypothetical protein
VTVVECSVGEFTGKVALTLGDTLTPIGEGEAATYIWRLLPAYLLTGGRSTAGPSH